MDGLDLDMLDDNDFFQMRQLTAFCENELYDQNYDMLSEPSAPDRFQPNVDDHPHQLDYSPLSCRVEDSLVFNFPIPSSPSFRPQLGGDAAADADPITPSTSAFPPDSAPDCCSTDDVTEMKPRRGRKRLPETVSMSVSRRKIIIHEALKLS